MFGLVSKKRLDEARDDLERATQERDEFDHIVSEKLSELDETFWRMRWVQRGMLIDMDRQRIDFPWWETCHLSGLAWMVQVAFNESDCPERFDPPLTVERLPRNPPISRVITRDGWIITVGGQKLIHGEGRIEWE
jgi:hypothetical protein